MVYNFILNSISLPVFYAVSIFQREMEIPCIPLESLLELFNNGSVCGCCVSSGRSLPITATTPRCKLKTQCHTERIRAMLSTLITRRGFLPRESGSLLMWDTNCSPYITAFGNDVDRCDMKDHGTYGKVRPNSSCMRGRPSNGASRSIGSVKPSSWQQQQGRSGGDEDDDGDDGPAGSGAGEQANSGGGQSKVSESMVNDEACRMFAKQSFQYYTKPLAECAMITEGEFCNSVEEFTRMTTKFAQFFGDMPYFGKHKTVMDNLKIANGTPGGIEDFTSKQMFEQGQPIVRCR